MTRPYRPLHPMRFFLHHLWCTTAMVLICCVSYSAVAVNTNTRTHSPSSSNSITPSPSSDPSSSPSSSLSASPDPSADVTASETSSLTFSNSISESDVPSQSVTGTSATYIVDTPSPTLKATRTHSHSKSQTVSAETSKSPSRTSTETEDDSSSGTSSLSNDITLSNSGSASPTPSASPTFSSSPTTSLSDSPSNEPSPSESPSESAEIASGSKSGTPTWSMSVSEERASSSPSESGSPTSTDSLSAPSPTDEITKASKTTSMSSSEEISASHTDSLDMNTSTIKRGTPSESPTMLISISSSPTDTANASRTVATPTSTLSGSQTQSGEVTESRTSSHSLSPSYSSSNEPTRTIVSFSPSATPSHSQEATGTSSPSMGTPSLSDARSPSKSASVSPSLSMSSSASPTKSLSSERSGSNTRASLSHEVTNSLTASVFPSNTTSPTSTTSLSTEWSKSTSVGSHSPTTSTTYDFVNQSKTVRPSDSRLTPTSSQSHTVSKSIGYNFTTRSLTPTGSVSATLSGGASTSKSGTRTAVSPSDEPTETRTLSPSRTHSPTSEESLSHTHRSLTPSITHTPTEGPKTLSSSVTMSVSPSAAAASRSQTLTPTPSDSVLPTASQDVNHTESLTPSEYVSATVTPSSPVSVSASNSESAEPSKSLSVNVTASETPTSSPTDERTSSLSVSASAELSVSPTATESATASLSPSTEATSSATTSHSMDTPSASPTGIISTSSSLSPSPTNEESLSNSPTPSASVSSTAEVSLTLSMTVGSKTPSATSSVSVTTSQPLSPTRGSYSPTLSVTQSSEGSASRTSSRSRGTPTLSASPSPSSTEELSRSRSSSNEQPTPTITVEVVESDSHLPTPSSSRRTRTKSHSEDGSRSTSVASYGHVRNATSSVSPSGSTSASLSEELSMSASLTPATASQALSLSATVVPTTTPSLIHSATPTIVVSLTRASLSLSLTGSGPSGTRQVTKSISLSTTPSGSVTVSREQASFTTTRSLIRTPTRTQSFSISPEMSHSVVTQSLSFSQQAHSASQSASRSLTASKTVTSSASEETSPTASLVLNHTISLTIENVTSSLSSDPSSSVSLTSGSTVSVSFTPQDSQSPSPSRSEDVTITPSRSVSDSPFSASTVPTESFQPNSATVSIKASDSKSLDVSQSLSLLATNTSVLTLSESPSTSGDPSSSVTLSGEPSTSSSLSISMSEAASVSDSWSRTSSRSPLDSHTPTLADSRTIIPSTSTSGSEEMSSSKSTSDEHSSSKTIASTFTAQESDSMTTVHSATVLISASGTLSVSGEYSKTKSWSLDHFTPTSHWSTTRSSSPSLSGVSSATRSSPNATATITEQRSSSSSPTFSEVYSVTRSDNWTLTITKGQTVSRKPSNTFSTTVDISQTVSYSRTSTFTTNTYSITFSKRKPRGVSDSVSMTSSMTLTVLSTPTTIVSVTTTETVSINTSHTLSRNTPTLANSRTVTFSQSTTQMVDSKSPSQSPSFTFAYTPTRQSSSPSESQTATFTSTVSLTDSQFPSITASLGSTGTLTITPPPTPTHSFSTMRSSSVTSTTTNSQSMTWTFTLRLSVSENSLTYSESGVRTYSPSRTPSTTTDNSMSTSNSLSHPTMSEEFTLSQSATHEISSSPSTNGSDTAAILPTPTKSILLSYTTTLLLSRSVSISRSKSATPSGSSSFINVSMSLTLSNSQDVTETRTLIATDSISASPTNTLNYISPNATFATSPYSSVFVFTAGRFIAIRFQGIPFNTTGDRAMLSPVNSSCGSPPSGGYVPLTQSWRPAAANILAKHNWTAFPRLSGEFSICYFSTTSNAWHKIIYPTRSIHLYASVPGTSVIAVQNNTAIFSQYTIVVYGGNTTSDRPFLVRYGVACTSASATKVYGVLHAYDNDTFTATIRFLNVPTPGDYSVCYLGYPHLDEKALLLSGTRRMRITGGVSDTLVGASVSANFKVGRTVSYAIRGRGLSVRDMFFLTNASFGLPPESRCSMPYHIPGSVRVSWGEIQRVQPTDTATSIYNLEHLTVTFLMSVPYNLSMCYRSNYSSTFTYVAGPLAYAVEPILPSGRAPNVSSSSLSAPSVWSLGGSFLHTFYGEGVSSTYDEAFLVLNMTASVDLELALTASTNSNGTTFTTAAVMAAAAGCLNTSGALAVVHLTPVETTSAGVSFFTAAQLPSFSADITSAIFASRGIPATVCYKSNFSRPLNMGTVLLTTSFWNTSDVATSNLFMYGVPMGSNISVAIASEAVTPGNSNNIFYLLFGVSAQCVAVPPLSSVPPLSRNRTHASFRVDNRGIYQLCAVCSDTNAVQNASFPVTPNDPNTITPSMIGLMHPTTVTFNGGVDFTATTTHPDVLYACDHSLAGALTITPATSNTVVITSRFQGNITLCVRFGVQRNLTDVAGVLTVSPFVHNVRSAPQDHRVGAVITIYVEGYGLNKSDVLYPCYASTTLLPIHFVSFNCSNATSYNNSMCMGIFNATATGAGAFPLCYKYSSPDAFPEGRLLNLSTGATVDLSFDADARSIAPTTMLASLLTVVNLTGSGMANGVLQVFLRSIPGEVCEGAVSPVDAIYFSKHNTSNGMSTSSSLVPDGNISWSQWSVSTSSARGVLALCYISNSGAAYTAGYLTVKSIVANFTSTQEYVTSAQRYAGVPITLVVTGAAMLVVNDSFFMVEQLSHTCVGSSYSNGRSKLVATSSSAGATGLRTSITFSVTVPIKGTYKLCYVRNNNETDMYDVSSTLLAVSSSFFVTATNISLVGPSPFLAPMFRFLYATNVTNPTLVPYRTVSNVSSIRVALVPLGTSLLTAQLVGVNGLTILTITEAITFPVSNVSLCTNFPQSLLQSDTKYQFAMSFIALYNFDVSYCYSRIPSDYALGPVNLINELLALTSSDVSLMVDSRSTMSLVTRVSLNTPQTASRSTTLITSLLTSTADSLNIPDADITETLLLSHADIVNEIVTTASASASVGGGSEVTVAQSIVLEAVNRINLVGAKYCSSGLAGGTLGASSTISQDAFAAAIKTVPIGSSSWSVSVPGSSRSNSSSSNQRGINVTSVVSNPNSFVGCVMSTLTAENFIPVAAASTAQRSFRELADTQSTGDVIASASIVKGFNVPLMSLSLPGSTLSDPLGSLTSVVFSFAHPGIAGANLTLGVGLDATFYRFSPTTANAIHGNWVLDPAATATADNDTVVVTYDLSKSTATSSANPQAYFYLSGNYRVYEITPPTPVYQHDTPLVIYVCAVIAAHVIMAIVGYSIDRIIDRQRENPRAPTSAPRVLPPTAAEFHNGGEPLDHAEDVPPNSAVVAVRSPSPAGRKKSGPQAPKTRAHAAKSHEPDGAHIEVPFSQPDVDAPSHEPLDHGDKKIRNHLRINSKRTLHRWITPLLRPPHHPVGSATRFTTLATYWFAVSFFAYIILDGADYEHPAQDNVLYGLMAAVMATPLAVPSRITLHQQSKDVPSAVAAIGSIIAMVAAIFQTTITTAVIACAAVGVAVTPIVWLLWYRRSSIDTQPRNSRVPLIIGFGAHAVVHLGAVVFLLYQALSHGTPIAWKKNNDYFITVGVALALDMAILEPVKNHIIILLANHAAGRRQRHGELKMVKKAAKEARERAEAEEAQRKRAAAEEAEEEQRRIREKKLMEDQARQTSRSRHRGETDTEFERSEDRSSRRRHQLALPGGRGQPRPPTYLDSEGRRSFYDDPYPDYDSPRSTQSKRHSASVDKQLDEYDDAPTLSSRNNQFEDYFEDDEDERAFSDGRLSERLSVPVTYTLSPRQAAAPSSLQHRHSTRSPPEEDNPPLEEVDLVTSFASNGSAFSSFASDDVSDEKTSPQRIYGDRSPRMQDEDEELVDQAPAPANSRPTLQLNGSDTEESERSHRRQRRNTRLSVASDTLYGDWEAVVSGSGSSEESGRRSGRGATAEATSPFDADNFDGVPYVGSSGDDEGDIVTEDENVSDLEIDYLDNAQQR